MTYDGKNNTVTRKSSLVHIPEHTIWRDILAAQLTTSSGTNVRHAHFVIGDYVYVLEGINDSRGFLIFRAPKDDPTSLSYTGSNIMVTQSAAVTGFGPVHRVGDFVYIFGYWTGAAWNRSIWRCHVDNPLSWYDTGSDLPGDPPQSAKAVYSDGTNVYIFTGTTIGDADRIMVAPVSDPVAGWTISGSTLAAGRPGAIFIETPTYIWAIGGFNFGGSAWSDTIQYCAKSNPLSWSLHGSTFPILISGGDCYVSGTHMWVINGADATSTPIDDVYRATLDDPSTFVKVYDNSRARYNHSVLVTDDLVVVYGGTWTGGTNMYTAERSELDVLDPTPWGSVPFGWPSSGVTHYTSYSLDNRIMVYGGYTVSGFTTDLIQTVSHKYPTWVRTEIYNDTTGDTDNFSDYYVPDQFVGGTVVRVKTDASDYLYLFGGADGLSGAVYRASVNDPTVTVDIGATNGPTTCFGKGFIHNDYIYHMGGDNLNSTTSNTIKRASIYNPAVWTTLPLTLPTTLTRFNLAIIGNYLWIFGGATSVSAGNPTVATAAYSISLDSLGNTGTTGWLTHSTAYASNQWGATMIVTGTHVHLIGGQQNLAAPITSIQSTSVLDLMERNFRAFTSTGTLVTGFTGGQAHYLNGDYYIPGVQTASGGPIAANALLKSLGGRLVKTFTNIPESYESTPAYSLQNGGMTSFNKYLQSGNFPWLTNKPNVK